MTRTRLLTLLGTAFAAVALLCSGATAGTASFSDPTGDSTTAPDITSVALSDDAAGLSTLVVTASALNAGSSIDVFLDTDKNDSTGSPCGCEYYFEVWQEANDWGWDVERWSGTAWQETPDSATEHFSRSGNVFTWTFSRADIGNSTGVSLWAGSFLFDSGNTLVARDLAPDGGRWVYDFAAAVVVGPTIGKPLAVPAIPAPGKLLSLSFPVQHADNGAVVVKTTIAGKAVASVATLASGAANVAVRDPEVGEGQDAAGEGDRHRRRQVVDAGRHVGDQEEVISPS